MSQESDENAATLRDEHPKLAELTRPPDNVDFVGTTLGGRYLIEKELGRGGIGVVYLARDKPELLSRLVVVKVLLEDSLRNSWVVNKFRHEIEALSRLDHPGIVGIFDTGELPDGKPYIVMQYVEGTTLREAMRPEGMELWRAAEIIRQIGCALDEAHEQQIFHRDLKPENVMLRARKSGEEQVKVIDFGIAKVKNSVMAPSTVTALMVGTVCYMSPEQLKAEPISAASDIYALGLIAYELVAGRRPFNPETSAQLLGMQKDGVRLKPRDLRPGLPEAAQAAILQALAYEPQDRQQKASDFGNAFAAAVNSNAEPARPRSAPASHDRQTDPPTLKLAHVLYMDIVGYSRLPMGQQMRVLQRLQEITRGAQEFRDAETNDHLISLPAGDGMALVFFRDPIAPVQCAIEVSRALRDNAEIHLRMGIHTGPVYQVTDINANRNVAGGGINMAQRVMDCGDAGHILMSKSVADVLAQLDEWADYAHDLGETEVKHDVRVHLFNFYNAEIGNPHAPEKLRRTPPPRRRFKIPVVASLILAAVLLLGLSVSYFTTPVTDSASKTGERSAQEDASKSGNATGPEIAERAAPAQHPERSLVFWLDVQKMSDGREVGKPFTSAGQEPFNSGWKFRFGALPRQDGSLYLINEGPKSDGAVGYWVLYPTPEDNGGTPRLKANQQLETRRWNKFDQNAGTEKVWLVWSEQPLPQLDSLVKDAASRKFEVAERAQINALRAVLDDPQLPKPLVEFDKDTGRATLKVRGSVIVHPLELLHQP